MSTALTLVLGTLALAGFALTWIFSDAIVELVPRLTGGLLGRATRWISVIALALVAAGWITLTLAGSL